MHSQRLHHQKNTFLLDGKGKKNTNVNHSATNATAKRISKPANLSPSNLKRVLWIAKDGQLLIKETHTHLNYGDNGKNAARRKTHGCKELQLGAAPS